MAIDFINITIISRAAGDIAPALVAYIQRERWTHESDGRRHSAGLGHARALQQRSKRSQIHDPLDGTISRAALSATTSISRLHGFAAERTATPEKRRVNQTRHSVAAE